MASSVSTKETATAQDANSVSDNEALPKSELDPEIVLAAFDGDAHAAIAGLIHDIEVLRHELALTRLAVSNGYSRGWHNRKDRPL